MGMRKMKYDRVDYKVNQGLSEAEQRAMIEELAREKGIEIIDNLQQLKSGDKVLTLDKFNRIVETEVPEEYQTEKSKCI